ncbi:hypothetical protein Tco_0073686 [Tanacetum coccineum]
MESNDMKSSCLENKVRELHQLREQESLMEQEYESVLKSLKSFFQDLDIKIVESSHHKSFEFLFGQAFNLNRGYRIENGVKDEFLKNIDKLEKFHELKKPDGALTTSNKHLSIEKRIDERACHEEELRIKEQNVKERRNDQGKSSSPGNDTDAEGAQISKNGLDDDITIAKSYHDNDKTELQDKNKDLENIMCKMGKSTETLRLLTNEQRAYQDNIRMSGLGYKGPCVLSQAYAKIPKLYSAYELHDENVQLNVFDSEKTLEDAEKSRLKMKEFQKDEKVQELKIKPIDYTNLNNLYETFVPQVKLSLKQKYFLETFISSEYPSNESSPYSSETKPTKKLMPSANPILVDLNKMENDFQTLFELLQTTSKRESILYTSPKEIRDLDETLKQNKLLKDRLLQVTLAEDVKNLVINSCVEIGNTNLQDEIERLSKESKDVSNESKTVDKFCNDAFDVTQELSKRIVDLEKDLSKLEAQNITYKYLFESVQRSKVETNQCDEVKVKVNFEEIETKNIELEHRVASLLKENEHLKLIYKNLFDSIKKPRVQKENLRSTLSEFAITHILGKDDSYPSSITENNISELEKESGENICENVKCELQTKIIKLEKVDDSKAENDQFLKENNHLRTQLENLKGKSVETKFDKPSILGKPPSDKLSINSQISKSWFTPKVAVKKNLSKPVTAQSLSKNEKDQLLKRIASLESKLASQDIRSC